MTGPTGRTKEEAMKKKVLLPYVYLIPGFILLAVFMYYPILSNVWYSSLKWDLFSGSKKFVGFSNYTKLFAASEFWVALINNIKYVTISLIFQVLIALVFAARIEQMKCKRLATAIRSIFFIPSLISLTVIGLLFTFVYKTDGLLNSIINIFGGNFSKGWLGDPKTAIYSVIAVSQWKSMGYTMMLLIVSIQRIPLEIYEACKIDGASNFVIFRKITIPLISDMIKIAIVINISGGLLVFNEIFVMTNGGPHGSSEVLSTLMYKNAFVFGKVGFASAISIIILALSVSFFFVNTIISKKDGAL